ncbi:cupin domain-containing protein [Methylobacterium sp. WSM2598]|uniref:cupin domain-containing protein n=1 Tax=Methylobacterium sp. WSM2598 TaxID=398261 RepID=UPI00036AAF61|nr:cupin domain-containing protein [Methylobacterium sp. WSM2598]
MLTRRNFAGFVSCAICTATGFLATDVSAQNSPAATPGLKRKLLKQTEGPMPGYVTLLMEVEIDAGTTVARHTHPGIESSYVLDGEIEVPIQGQETKTYKVGEGFQVPPNTPHAGSKVGPKSVRLGITYIVEKDKPLASPA